MLFILSWAIYRSVNAPHWRHASRESSHISPIDVTKDPRAVVQIYVARAYGWRGVFGVHSWLAYRKKAQPQFNVAQVIGWRLFRHNSAVSWQPGIPDRLWFGSKPELIFQSTGERAEAMIPQIEQLIENYPYSSQYRVWPGPNSNTFIAYIIRHVAEIDVELPPHAIGKDWLGDTWVCQTAMTHSGLTCSAFGVAGFTLGLKEGVEIFLLGLNFGFDTAPFALKLPIVGRLGWPEFSPQNN